MIPLSSELPVLFTYLPDVLERIFTLNPSEPFKTGVKIVAMLGVFFGILTTLLTKTLPWLRATVEGRSVSKSLGPEFPRASIQRAVRYYIRPFCQDLDPAGSEEPRLVFGVQQKLFEALDKALTHPTEYHFVILLADSGMGKTSALINYYARHLRRVRKPFRLKLIPLGIPNCDERIAEITDRRNTVLFLDALDEDTLATVDHVERLKTLLRATNDFERVVISCRTQFFSKEEEIPKETGKIKVGSRAAGEPAEYFFHKIYLSPFSDDQVSDYLKRRYPIWRVGRRWKARSMVQKIPHLTARPMLLAHIDDLVSANRVIRYSSELYEEMVAAWLRREQGFIQQIEDLRQFSERLAVDIFLNREKRGSERVKKSELSELARAWHIPLDDWKLTGRSLLNRDTQGNYKFAHRSIMEYLFVRRFLSGATECIAVEWTDQMFEFYLEMLDNRREDADAFKELSSLSPLSDRDERQLGFLKSLTSGLLRRIDSNEDWAGRCQLLATLCFRILATGPADNSAKTLTILLWPADAFENRWLRASREVKLGVFHSQRGLVSADRAQTDMFYSNAFDLDTDSGDHSYPASRRADLVVGSKRIGELSVVMTDSLASYAFERQWGLLRKLVDAGVDEESLVQDGVLSRESADVLNRATLLSRRVGYWTCRAEHVLASIAHLFPNAITSERENAFRLEKALGEIMRRQTHKSGDVSPYVMSELISNATSEAKGYGANVVEPRHLVLAIIAESARLADVVEKHTGQNYRTLSHQTARRNPAASDLPRS